MPTTLKPSYPSLDAIPENQRDFYVLNTTDNVYELAQEGTALADHFNRQIARKRDEFRDEKDRTKRENDRLVKENTRLTESADRLRRTRDDDVNRLTDQLTKAENDLRKATTEGGVVLSKDDAAILEKFKKLGKPEDVTANKLDAIYTHVEKTVQEAETLRDENAQHKLDGTLRDVSDLLGWNFAALRDVIRHPDYGKDLEVVIESVKDKESGEQVQTPFVKFKKDNKDEKLALTEYADEHWHTWLPALTAENGNGDHEDRGTKLVRQKPSTQRRGDEGDRKPKLEKKIESFNEERNRAANPLNPQPAAK